MQSPLVEVAMPRKSARWVVALAFGLRQGEAFGLHWEDVDLDAGYIRIRKNRLRPKYAHGCGDTRAVGRLATALRSSRPAVSTSPPSPVPVGARSVCPIR